MAEYQWIMATLAVLTLAVGFAGYVMRKQQALSEKFDRLYRKIEESDREWRSEVDKLEERVNATREDMMRNYVRYPALQEHLAESDRRLDLKLSNLGSEIQTAMSKALAEYSKDEYARTREIAKQIIQDITGVKG